MGMKEYCIEGVKTTIPLHIGLWVTNVSRLAMSGPGLWKTPSSSRLYFDSIV